MLPYFRSMEAFFNLSLPTDWQSLPDSQLQYFFTQFSHDLPMEEILTLCLFKWADLRVLCKTHDGSYLVKRRRKQKQETTLTIRQVQAATASWNYYGNSLHCRFASLKSEEPLPSKPTSRACRSRRSSLPTTTLSGFSPHQERGYIERPRHASVPKGQVASPHNTAFAQRLLLVLVAEAVPRPIVSALPAADVQFF